MIGGRRNLHAARRESLRPDEAARRFTAATAGSAATRARYVLIAEVDILWSAAFRGVKPFARSARRTDSTEAIQTIQRFGLPSS